MPGDTNYGQHHAQVVLRFLIVGGGLAGLATAYCLKMAGHEVLVIEKGDARAKSRGGLQSPPNMTKILHRWGLGPMLAQKARKCDQFVFWNADTAEYIGTMIMSEEFLQDLIGDFLFFRHADLHEMLYNLALQEGVEFRFQTEVMAFAESSGVGNVILKSGEVISGDIVIAADGYDSASRPWVAGLPSSSSSNDGGDQAAGYPTENSSDADKHVAVTFTVPVADFQANEDLGALFGPSDWFSAMGEGYIISAFHLIESDDIIATLTYRYPKGSTVDIGDDDEWTDERDLDSLQLDMNAFEPRIQKFLRMPRVVSSRKLVARPSPVEDVVSECGKVILIGNAAHPMLPGSIHGTALCIEDAQTLGLLFSRIQSREQIPRLVTAFDEIRHPHSSKTHTYDYMHYNNLVCPKGPHQSARDAVLRQSMVHGDSWEHIDEDAFRFVWEKELELYAHDASERVEDWWIQWGALISRNRQSGRLSVIANMSVSVSKAGAAPAVSDEPHTGREVVFSTSVWE